MPLLPKIIFLCFMKIKSISLVNFRNYKKKIASFNFTSNLIIGPNMSGKTNLLEAIFLLATSKSFKAETNLQIINWEEKYCLVEAKLGSGQTMEIKIISSPESKLVKKVFTVDGTAKTRKDFLPLFYAILFRPEDIRILSGSPSRRRNFLDNILSQIDWQYRKTILVYQKALRQRNKLLEKIRTGQSNLQELFYWDKALVKNGQYINSQRRNLTEKFNTFFENHPQKTINVLSIKYLPNLISEKMLTIKKNTDINLGHTSIGPHKDDYTLENSQFNTKDKNIAFWGSRAQQRMAVLGLKLAELDFIEKEIGRKPILLLDDIFSELDENHQRLLTQIINHHQTIITATQKPDGLPWKPESIITLA